LGREQRYGGKKLRMGRGKKKHRRFDEKGVSAGVGSMVALSERKPNGREPKKWGAEASKEGEAAG